MTKQRQGEFPAGTPGLKKPVRAGTAAFGVDAWLDTDKSRGDKRRYHVVIRAGKGGGEHDLFSLEPAALLKLAAQLVSVHAKLTGTDPDNTTTD